MCVSGSHMPGNSQTGLHQAPGTHCTPSRAGMDAAFRAVAQLSCSVCKHPVSDCLSMYICVPAWKTKGKPKHALEMLRKEPGSVTCPTTHQLCLWTPAAHKTPTKSQGRLQWPQSPPHRTLCSAVQWAAISMCFGHSPCHNRPWDREWPSSLTICGGSRTPSFTGLLNIRVFSL